jgi:hypothetical protein
VDWNSLAASFGGDLSAGVAFMQLRGDKAQALQARRWIDAEVVADARSLLMDLDPQRRAINANPAPGVEDALWKDLRNRRDQLYRQLLLLAAGHPSHEVAEAANELETALLWTAQQSEFAVSELLANRINPKLTEATQERHASARMPLPSRWRQVPPGMECQVSPETGLIDTWRIITADLGLRGLCGSADAVRDRWSRQNADRHRVRPPEQLRRR